ncbi:hypothetical protein LTR56_020480 [Elasticomyces elasticus]|nr:hypothetical protein LTR56_020480 [Elasticomyces elasticus]KAK3642711.1 hypothetical protein LTR22_015966 [Elasticomyces elasticus]KAK4910162.1 hypothetical protein LTR49_021128 [Elasticomyces elasticus]KAK5766405.1 hypothetical protein LTS12_003322 [Elasticomyces elasticus]
MTELNQVTREYKYTLPVDQARFYIEALDLNKQTPKMLAFCMSEDPEIHDQKQMIARVPLSDYVIEPTQVSTVQNWVAGGRGLHSGSDIGYDPTTKSFTELHCHAASLLKWQEQQTVLLNVDSRFRFRCIVSWLDTSSSSQLKRITSQAGVFLQKHTQDHYKLLRAEAESLKQLLTDRQDEGRSLTERQFQQVHALDEDMQSVVEASKMVRELVELAVSLGMLEGEIKLNEAISLAPASIPAAGKDEKLVDGALGATEIGAPDAMMDPSA